MSSMEVAVGVLPCRFRRMPSAQWFRYDVPLTQKHSPPSFGAPPSLSAGNKVERPEGPDRVDALQQQQDLQSQQPSLCTPGPLSAPHAAAQHPQQQHSQELHFQVQMRKEQSDHDRTWGMAFIGDDSFAMNARPEAPAGMSHRSPPLHSPLPSPQTSLWDQAVHWLRG